VNINPGAGGAFTAIGAGPTGVIIAGSDLGGACRSLDHGASWDVIGSFRGLRHTHVNSVGFDPLDARVIYLGAEDALYRSADGGAHFRPVLDSVFVSAIAAAPSDPSIVYAGVSSDYNTLDARIWRSADRGVTWRRAGGELSGLRILKLIVDAGDPRRIYLLSGVDLFTKGASRSLFRSEDGGAKWRRIASDLGAITDVDADPGAPAVLYATSGEADKGAVFRSDDRGATWARKAKHGGAILTSPGRPGIVRVVDVSLEPSDWSAGVWESRDGGATWGRRGSPRGWETGWQTPAWALGPNRYGLAKTLGRDLSNPDAIFWVDAQFVHGSFDGGRTFANLFTNEVREGWWRGRGIDNAAVLALAIDETDPRRIFAGSFDIGLWRSLDGGASWQSCNDEEWTGAWKGHGGNTATIALDPQRAGRVWAASGETVDRSMLLRSDRGGAPGSWTEAGHGLPHGFIAGLSLDRASDPRRRTLFVTANGDVYRSVDDGQSWSQVLGGAECRVTGVERDGRVVYAGGERGVWRSSRGGEPGSWTAAFAKEMKGDYVGRLRDFQWEGVHDIEVDPERPGRVYVTAYGVGRGLYRSDDRGATWKKLRGSDYARAVAVDPAGLIYLTTSPACRAGGAAEGSDGILRSDDGGRTWASLADGLAWPFGGPIAIDPGDARRVYLGSPGCGFQVRTLPARAAPAPRAP
jgi:BNR-Asp box repeat protein